AGTGRVIVIPSPLLAPLRAQQAYVLAHQQARAVWTDYDLLFPSTRGTPLEERRVVTEFKAALERAGLPTTVRLYDRRHTAASVLYAQGVPPLQIAEILGHTDPNFTVRTYTHTWQELRNDAAAKMGDLLIASGALPG